MALALLVCRPGEAAKKTDKVDCATLPAAVQAAAAKVKTKPGTTSSCERIVEDGRTLFEVKATMASGKVREIVYRADGQLQEWEEETDLASIPAAARAAIEKARGTGVLRKVDLIQRGRQMLYEGEYLDGAAKRKLIVDANGRPVPE